MKIFERNAKKKDEEQLSDDIEFIIQSYYLESTLIMATKHVAISWMIASPNVYFAFPRKKKPETKNDYNSSSFFWNILFYRYMHNNKIT